MMPLNLVTNKEEVRTYVPELMVRRFTDHCRCREWPLFGCFDNNNGFILVNTT